MKNKILFLVGIALSFEAFMIMGANGAAGGGDAPFNNGATGVSRLMGLESDSGSDASIGNLSENDGSISNDFRIDDSGSDDSESNDSINNDFEDDQLSDVPAFPLASFHRKDYTESFDDTSQDYLADPADDEDAEEAGARSIRLWHTALHEHMEALNAHRVALEENTRALRSLSERMPF